MEWIYHNLSVHLFDGHFGCLQVMAAMNEAAKNIVRPVFAWIYVLISPKYLGELLNCKVGVYKKQ